MRIIFKSWVNYTRNFLNMVSLHILLNNSQGDKIQECLNIQSNILFNLSKSDSFFP